MHCGLLVVLLAILPTIFGGISIPKSEGIDSRIVGGQATTIEQHPYQALVRALNTFTCGGVIYSTLVVLTSAQCVDTVKNIYSIDYGSTDVISGTNIKVKSVLKHPSFNRVTLDFDIAILKLEKKIVFGPKAQPIGLATSPMAAGTNAVVTGYGTTSEGGQQSNVLEEVTVSIIDRLICDLLYDDIRDITNNMICAGELTGGKDACQGDAGGPLVSGGILIGIASWGYGCARPLRPGVYSNMVTLGPWVEVNAE